MNADTSLRGETLEEEKSRRKEKFFTFFHRVPEKEKAGIKDPFILHWYCSTMNRDGVM